MVLGEQSDSPPTFDSFQIHRLLTKCVYLVYEMLTKCVYLVYEMLILILNEQQFLIKFLDMCDVSKKCKIIVFRF